MDLGFEPGGAIGRGETQGDGGGSRREDRSPAGVIRCQRSASAGSVAFKV